VRSGVESGRRWFHNDVQVWKAHLNIEELKVLEIRSGGERGNRWLHNNVKV